MEIFNEVDYILIIVYIAVFFLIYYFYYKFILKNCYATLAKTFERDYKEIIKNNNTYFTFELFYCFLGISIILTCIFLLHLIEEESSISINVFVASIILAFLYCLKQGYLKFRDK